MTIDVTLTDAGGQVWDFSSDRSVDINGNFQLGFGLEDGQSDTVDNGFVLLVNGTAVNPQAASVDEGGREINTAPVLIDGVAVSRSVLVSDVVSFARVLDSFTNTTDAASPSRCRPWSTAGPTTSCSLPPPAMATPCWNPATPAM